MVECRDFAVIHLPTLKWPSLACIPSSRFSLFVAADTADVNSDVLSEFGNEALSRGMAYFCAWGSGCERFHDIVDEVALQSDLGAGWFSWQTDRHVVMTTWHEHDTLEEALDFFVSCAVPTNGFGANSKFRLVLCCGDEEWAKRAGSFLQSHPRQTKAGSSLRSE